MMKLDDSRRHCASCERIVWDFTKMTDAELVAFLSANKNLCGKFTAAQLNRELLPQSPKQNKRISWLLPLLLFAAPAFAQTAKPHPTQQVPQKKKKTSAPSPKLLTVEGSVHQQYTGFPLQDANVTIRTSSDTVKLTTDATGNYCATIPRAADDSVVIEVSLPGYLYYTKEIVITEGYIFSDVQLEKIEAGPNIVIQEIHYAGVPIYDPPSVIPPRQSFFYRIFHWRKVRKTKKDFTE